MTPTHDEMVKLIRVFSETVDGGCPYCTRQAVQACAMVFPAADWDAAFREVEDRGLDEEIT